MGSQAVLIRFRFPLAMRDRLPLYSWVQVSKPFLVASAGSYAEATADSSPALRDRNDDGGAQDTRREAENDASKQPFATRFASESSHVRLWPKIRIGMSCLGAADRLCVPGLVIMSGLASAEAGNRRYDAVASGTNRLYCILIISASGDGLCPARGAGAEFSSLRPCALC